MNYCHLYHYCHSATFAMEQFFKENKEKTIEVNLIEHCVVCKDYDRHYDKHYFISEERYADWCKGKTFKLIYDWKYESDTINNDEIYHSGCVINKKVNSKFNTLVNKLFSILKTLKNKFKLIKKLKRRNLKL